MWAIALKFIKEKLFSEMGTLLIVVGVIVLLFAGPVTETFLTRFGFETKTSLKADLVSTKKDLQTTLEANDSIKRELTVTKSNLETAMKTLEENRIAREKMEKDIKNIVEIKDTKTKPQIQKLKNTTRVTEKEITLDRVAVDAVSEANIDAVNDVYTNLFETERT